MVVQATLPAAVAAQDFTSQVAVVASATASAALWGNIRAALDIEVAFVAQRGNTNHTQDTAAVFVARGGSIAPAGTQVGTNHGR